MRGESVPRVVCALLGHAWEWEYQGLALPLVKACRRCGVVST